MAGTGHLGLFLAWLRPDASVVLVERKEFCAAFGAPGPTSLEPLRRATAAPAAAEKNCCEQVVAALRNKFCHAISAAAAEAEPGRGQGGSGSKPSG